MFREKDLANFDSIYKILHGLPPEIMYVIRTYGLVSTHFANLGGSRRQRIFTFTDFSLRYFFIYLEFFVKVGYDISFPIFGLSLEYGSFNFLQLFIDLSLVLFEEGSIKFDTLLLMKINIRKSFLAFGPSHQEIVKHVENEK